MDTISSGIVAVSSGVVSRELLVVQEGVLQILNGGTAEVIVLSDKGKTIVSSGGILYGCTVSEGGTATVLRDGYAQDVTVDGGLFAVSSGGTAYKSFLHSDGRQTVYAEAMAVSTIVSDGGVLDVKSGGYARIPLVSQGGVLRIGKDALVDQAYICGSAEVNEDAALNSATVSDGGTINVLASGYAYKAAVGSGGALDAASGGIVNSAAVYEGGTVMISAGASAYNMQISGGKATLAGETVSGKAIGASASNTTVHSGGSLIVSSGATANCTVVRTNGRLEVFSGGILTGRVTVENGAAVSADEGTILNFDLTKTEAEADAFLNDLSRIQGTPLYTLTVDGMQADGTYSLADGAADFDGTISVMNTAGDNIGKLTVGETVKASDVSYTLNLTDSLLFVTVMGPVPPPPEDLVGTTEGVSWKPNGANGCIVDYSTDDFEHVIRVVTAGNAIDTPDLPAGTYQWRVKTDEGSDWAVGEAIESEAKPDVPEVVQSNGDGDDDLFFAKASGTWEKIYYAKHVGSVNDWTGTSEFVSASGKGRIHDLFFGSNDANILCLTDDKNGEAIFLDDEFTDLPQSITEQQARIARIDEIRAGAGDDIVDMTSQRHEYIGDGMTIRGGDGNDTIWANKGSNMLFGDAGNDRIVGASGVDVIVGGIDDDSMHGGGGNDLFTFCDNWGSDTVQQLETGTVMLWFANGSSENWNAETMTYTDGDNSVKVLGVTADNVFLEFGDDGSGVFKDLASAGAFAEFTSQKIFEDSRMDILA